jgi:hypothetical protein
MNVVYVTNIDTSKIVLALSSAWNWKETEKFRFFCLASISVGLSYDQITIWPNAVGSKVYFNERSFDRKLFSINEFNRKSIWLKGHLIEKSCDRKLFFRKNWSFYQKTERYVNKYILHTKIVLNIGSKWHLACSVNRLFVEKHFRSNDHLLKKAFGQTSFRSNDTIFKFHYRFNENFPAKRRSDKWQFSQMTFRSLGVRSNVVRSNGVSIKRHSVKKKSVKWFFGKMIFQ